MAACDVAALTAAMAQLQLPPSTPAAACVLLSACDARLSAAPAAASPAGARSKASPAANRLLLESEAPSKDGLNGQALARMCRGRPWVAAAAYGQQVPAEAEPWGAEVYAAVGAQLAGGGFTPTSLSELAVSLAQGGLPAPPHELALAVVRAARDMGHPPSAAAAGSATPAAAAAPLPVAVAAAPEAASGGPESTEGASAASAKPAVRVVEELHGLGTFSNAALVDFVEAGAQLGWHNQGACALDRAFKQELAQQVAGGLLGVCFCVCVCICGVYVSYAQSTSRLGRHVYLYKYALPLSRPFCTGACW